MVVRRSTLSLAARAMSRLAPRAGTWAQPVIPPAQPVASIPHGKLASATETSFWRDSIFLGESGNIHRVLLSPPRSFFEVKGKSEKEKHGIKEDIIGWTFTEEQQKIMLPQDGLVLSTICDGKVQKHLHLEYRGQQGVRLRSDQFPMVPPEADGEGHWPRIQVVVYPFEGRCTFTFYDGEGTKHWVDTSINLGMEYITSCNVHHFQNFPDPSIGLLYEKSLGRELFASMILRPTTSGCNFSEDDVIHKHGNVSVYISRKQEGLDSSSKSNKGLLQDQDVALKTFIYTSGVEPMEAHIGKQIVHPNMQSFYAFWRESETVVCIALELCARNLEEFGKCGFKFDMAQRLFIFLDIATGAKKCEMKGVCHRNIRITNILLNDSGIAKLSGFHHAAITQGEPSILEGKSEGKSRGKSKGKSKGKSEQKSDGWSVVRSFPPVPGKGAASKYSPPELAFDKFHSAKVVPYNLGSAYYYLMSSSADPKKALQNFINVVGSSAWKKDMNSTWKTKNLSDDWHGDRNLLFGMFQIDPDLRLSIDDIIARIRKLIQEL